METNDFDSAEIYKNIHRPKVDAIFKKRDKEVEEASKIYELATKQPEKEKFLLSQITEHLNLAKKYDMEARALWKQIISESKKLKR